MTGPTEGQGRALHGFDKRRRTLTDVVKICIVTLHLSPSSALYHDAEQLDAEGNRHPANKNAPLGLKESRSRVETAGTCPLVEVINALAPSREQLIPDRVGNRLDLGWLTSSKIREKY